MLSLGSLDAQAELVRRCIQDTLSVRDAEYAATLWKEEGIFPWLKIEEEDHPRPQGSQEQAQDQTEQAESPPLEHLMPLRKIKPPLLQHVQKRLRRDLKIRANISGTEARGRISLSYQSQEELHALLQRLGINTTDFTGEEAPHESFRLDA